MVKSYLWCCGDDKYNKEKADFIELLKKDNYEYTITEKYHKAGVTSALTNNTGEIYDYIVIHEKLERIKIEPEFLEKLSELSSKSTIIYILDNSHKGDGYAQRLLGIGVYNVIYESELSGERLYDVVIHPMTRSEAKLYLGLNASNVQGVDENTIAKIILHLQKEDGAEKRTLVFEHLIVGYSESDIFRIIEKLPEDIIKDLAANTYVSAFINSRTTSSSSKMKFKVGSSEKEPKVIEKVVEKVITQEKVIRETIEIEVAKPINFKKLILSVIDNAEFACELAYIISKVTDYLNYKVLLINLDLSYIPGKYLGLKEIIRERHEENPNRYGISNLTKEVKDSVLDSDMLERSCIKRDDMKNLFLLTEPKIYYRRNAEEQLNIKDLLDCAYSTFEVTIVMVNKSILDQTVIEVLKKADYNISAIKATADITELYETYIEHMEEYHKIDRRKAKVVAYEYNQKYNLPIGYFKGYINENSYMGCISYQAERELYRSSPSFFAKYAYKKHISQYRSILEQLAITPQRDLRDMTGGLVRDIRKMFKKATKTKKTKKVIKTEISGTNEPVQKEETTEKG